MTHAEAFAKINLGLVAGPVRADGKHEVVTVLQRVELRDGISIEAADELGIEGFPHDTLVREALEALVEATATAARWRVRIEKRIPVAAGLGGGSSDAATALRLANAQLVPPLDSGDLQRLAAAVGADVPFFLCEGAQLATGDGTELAPVALPTDYHVALVLPLDGVKTSTRAVYEAFDARAGAVGFAARAAALRAALSSISTAHDLRRLPTNDLASSSLAGELETLGAFRADVSGAGPTVYGLFERPDAAQHAAESLAGAGRTYVTRPVPAVDRA